MDRCLRCFRCNHEWLRRSLTANPIQCPLCHSPYWNRERLESSPRFYVYELRDEVGKVFYVGKGQGGRIKCHERDAEAGKKSPCAEAIQKIWDRGFSVRSEIVFRTDSEIEAFSEEIRRIEVYGKDDLVNRSDGGSGPLGVGPLKVTPDLQDLIRNWYLEGKSNTEIAGMLQKKGFKIGRGSVYRWCRIFGRKRGASRIGASE